MFLNACCGGVICVTCLHVYIAQTQHGSGRARAIKAGSPKVSFGWVGTVGAR